MTAGAAFDETGTDVRLLEDVAYAVASARPDALGQRELALKKLSSTPDRARRVAREDPGVIWFPTPCPT
jgi:hypothetical protein